MFPVLLAAYLSMAPVVPVAPIEPTAPAGTTAPSRLDAPFPIVPTVSIARPLAIEPIESNAPIGLVAALRPYDPFRSLQFLPPAWADDLPDLPPSLVSPHIVVLKSKRELQLYSADSIVRTYRVALGLEPVKPKVKQGDLATPEGKYYVCFKNPSSKYERALALSYPGPADAQRGLADGLISPTEHQRILDAWAAKQAPPFNTKLGGDVCIHGAGASWDWTEGCIALNTMDIEELYRVVPLGTSVEIRP